VTRHRRARPAPRVSTPAPPPSLDDATPYLPWLAIGVGVVALAAYGGTLQRGVPGGDSGELIASAVTGGVAHPPGYPLFLLLARAAALVPLGSIAARVNALSAVCDAAAAGLLTYAVARLSASTAAGVLAGGLFAFSTRVWAYATIAEVFALNNLLLAALLVTLAVAGPHPSRGSIGVASVLLGLGIANHHTSIFVSVPIVAWLLLAAWRAGTPPLPLLAWAAGGAVLGLLPYAYLPLAAMGRAAVSWGDAASLTGFVRHVTRAEYGTFQLASAHVGGDTSARDHVLAYVTDLLPQTLGFGVPLALLGAGAGLVDRRRRGVVAACLIGLVAYLVVFNALSNLPLGVPLLFEVQARFWQTPNLIVFFLLGLGAGTGLGWLPRGRVVTAGALAIAVVVVALQAWLHRAAMDESRMRWVEAYGRGVLAAAPPGALILSRGDLTTNVIHYLRYVERVRPDVQIIDQEILSLPWGPARYARLLPEVRIPAAVYDPRRPDGFSMKQLLDANVGRFAFLVCGGVKPGDDSVSPSTYRLLPRGSCAEVAPAGAPLAVDPWLARNRALLPDLGALTRAPLKPGSWEEVVRTDAWAAWHAPAYFVMMCTDCGLAPVDRYWRYVTLADELTRLAPGAPAYVYKNLAFALGQLYPTRPDVRDRFVAAMQEYLRRGPADDPDVPVMRDNLVKLGARVPD